MTAKTQIQRIHGILVLALVMLVGCRTIAPENNRLAGRRESEAKCSSASMAERRAATFERTKSCAVDAIGIGMAETVQAAALALGEAKALAAAIKAFNRMKPGTRFDINVAKGTLCAETLLGGYTAAETSKYVTEQMVTLGLEPDGEFKSITALAQSMATAGTGEVLATLGELLETPSLEVALKLGAKSTGSFGDIRQIFVTCAPVFSSVLHLDQLNVIHLANLGRYFGRIGIAGAIANCTTAGLFNAVDVETEVNCLIQDLRTVEQQNKKILAAEAARCEGLGAIASLPTSRPALEAVRNSFVPGTDDLDPPSLNRVHLCRQTIERWGRCLAATPLKTRSPDSCRKLCTMPSISIAADFERALQRTMYPDGHALTALVVTAAKSCTSPGNPDVLVQDGITPCVNLCLQSDW